MNERIKELAIKCATQMAWDIPKPPSEFTFSPEDIEKFAELIILECVQTLRDNTPIHDENESLEDWNKGYVRAMLDCEHHIQEHFGVER